MNCVQVFLEKNLPETYHKGPWTKTTGVGVGSLNVGGGGRVGQGRVMGGNGDNCN